MNENSVLSTGKAEGSGPLSWRAGQLLQLVSKVSVTLSQEKSKGQEGREEEIEEKAQQLGGPAVLPENLGSISIMATVSNPHHGRPNTLFCPPQAPHKYGAVINAGKLS